MKIGILGGGQLGKMFQELASRYPVECYYMDNSIHAPVSQISQNYSLGDIREYSDVMDFGLDKDVISIEIENVCVEALHDLQKKGKIVIPDPKCLEIIIDKGLQKKFYERIEVPSTRFELHESTTQLKLDLKFPIFQKYRTGGYDGKGVQKVNSPKELLTLENVPSVYEEAADIHTEISVQVFKDLHGNMVSYPIVKFVADPKLNLVDYLIFPTDFDKTLEKKAQSMAEKIAAALPGAGVFSVEMFLTQNQELLINETAPRVHNSGHSTIEASASSQFDQMLRILMGYPLGKSKHRLSAMWNILGPDDFTGECQLEGLEQLLLNDQCYVHWYGKKTSKPGRKLGHITFLAKDEKELQEKIQFAKSKIKVTKI